MNQSSGNESVIYVRMFGSSTIIMDEEVASDSDNRSREAWGLLSYLTTKRRGDVSINELFHAIWQDDVQDNPYGVLEVPIFRARKMLEAVGFPSQDFILNQKGAHMWSLAWETEVDTDRPEGLCRRILNPEGDGKNMRGVYLEAFELYRGISPSKLTEDSWVSPIVAYHHILYQKLAVYMTGKLIQDEEYGRVEEACQKVIDIDRSTEDFHHYWICVAYEQGEQEIALRRYKDTTSMFYREHLMTPLEHFKGLYKVISNSEQEVATDLSVTQESLGTGGAGEGHGVHQREYAVFKRPVQLGRRGVERSGDSVYLCPLTVGDRKGCTLKPEIQARATECPRVFTQKNLRSSDVYTRYSVSQLILLLSSVTFENNGMVMNRIPSAFNKLYVHKDVAVNYSPDVPKP